jgi:hypothetical protein
MEQLAHAPGSFAFIKLFPASDAARGRDRPRCPGRRDQGLEKGRVVSCPLSVEDADDSGPQPLMSRLRLPRRPHPPLTATRRTNPCPRTPTGGTSSSTSPTRRRRTATTSRACEQPHLDPIIITSFMSFMHCHTFQDNYNANSVQQCSGEALKCPYGMLYRGGMAQSGLRSLSVLLQTNSVAQSCAQLGQADL